MTTDSLMGVPGETAPPVPAWAAPPRVLDDVEMLLRGAYQPLRGFMGRADIAAVARNGRLADATPWPVAITLTVDRVVGEGASAAGFLDLHDEEGTPVARMAVRECWPVEGGGTSLAGELHPCRPIERGSHRALRRSAEGSAASGARTKTIGLPIRRSPCTAEIEALIDAATALGADVRLLPLTGAGNPDGMDAAILVCGCLRVQDELVARGISADVVPVAVPRHDLASEERRRMLVARVAQAYGATHVPGPLPQGEGLPVAIDLGVAPDERAPVPQREGLVVLFSGLSGSGKSTLANAVHDVMIEHGERVVTLLDGDLVRRMLSAELTFSREHRELNVRRIGFVAAQIARHGGTVLCAPIAPYAAGRAEVREMVEQAGARFVLVHVSTPLEVCEERDRKGLYAKARRGEIPHFTGVSDPYEQPVDADLVIDTSRIPLAVAVAVVVDALMLVTCTRLVVE